MPADDAARALREAAAADRVANGARVTALAGVRAAFFHEAAVAKVIHTVARAAVVVARASAVPRQATSATRARRAVAAVREVLAGPAERCAARLGREVTAKLIAAVPVGTAQAASL
jgi:hypothetical protein